MFTSIFVVILVVVFVWRISSSVGIVGNIFRSVSSVLLFSILMGLMLPVMGEEDIEKAKNTPAKTEKLDEKEPEKPSGKSKESKGEAQTPTDNDKTSQEKKTPVTHTKQIAGT